MPRLENWSFVNPNPYQSPEVSKLKLNGEIFEDERFPDGTNVITSTVHELDTDKMEAITKNTIYKLGKISASYYIWLAENGYKIGGLMKGGLV